MILVVTERFFNELGDPFAADNEVRRGHGQRDGPPPKIVDEPPGEWSEGTDVGDDTRWFSRNDPLHEDEAIWVRQVLPNTDLWEIRSGWDWMFNVDRDIRALLYGTKAGRPKTYVPKQIKKDYELIAGLDAEETDDMYESAHHAMWVVDQAVKSIKNISEYQK